MWHFLKDYENCISSVGQGGEFSADSFSVMCQSAPSSWRNTLGVSCSSASGTESCPGSLSGTMFALSTGTPGEDGLTSSPEVSPARTSAQPERALASTGSDPGFGLRWPGSFARFDPASSSWKTAQCSLLGDLEEFSGTWPRWGSMRDGECWAQTMPALPTFGNGSGFWPTSVARDQGRSPEAHLAMKARMKGGPRQAITSLAVMVKAVDRGMWPTPTAVTNTGGAALCKWGGSGARAKLRTMVTKEELNGSLNPQWVAWLMGWPIGWTSLEPLAMAKFRVWLRWHGRS